VLFESTHLWYYPAAPSPPACTKAQPRKAEVHSTTASCLHGAVVWAWQFLAKKTAQVSQQQIAQRHVTPHAGCDGALSQVSLSQKVSHNVNVKLVNKVHQQC
jgi:hypothetical protein